jgi:hypothetical protein
VAESRDHHDACDDQTFEFDGTHWSAVAVTPPLARIRASLAHDAARGRTVLFGGFGTGLPPHGGSAR